MFFMPSDVTQHPEKYFFMIKKEILDLYAAYLFYKAIVIGLILQQKLFQEFRTPLPRMAYQVFFKSALWTLRCCAGRFFGTACNVNVSVNNAKFLR